MGYTKFVRSGKYVEIFNYEKDYVHKTQPRRSKRDRKLLKEARAHRAMFIARERRKDNLSRSKKDFVRLVRANLEATDLPAFLTLTANETEPARVMYDALKLFWRRLAVHAPKLRYIAVPEFQERGTLHFHVLVWGLPDALIYDETPWYWRRRSKHKRSVIDWMQWCERKGFDHKSSRGTRNLQRLWVRGFCDIRPARDASSAIAFYMAKYMSKAMQDKRLVGQKAYTSSRNVMRPLQIAGNGVGPDISVMLEHFGHGDSMKTIAREYDTLWLGRCLLEVIE